MQSERELRMFALINRNFAPHSLGFGSLRLGGLIMSGEGTPSLAYAAFDCILERGSEQRTLARRRGMCRRNLRAQTLCKLGHPAGVTYLVRACPSRSVAQGLRCTEAR